MSEDMCIFSHTPNYAYASSPSGAKVQYLVNWLCGASLSCTVCHISVIERVNTDCSAHKMQTDDTDGT